MIHRPRIRVPLRSGSWVGLWLFFATAAFGERVTVATYNLENYLSTDRMVEGIYQRDYPKPEAAKSALRSVIRSLAADIIVFQEMGPLPYLKELQHDLAQDGLEYAHAELLEAEDAERHVAVLSRRRLKTLKHTDLSFDYFKKIERVKRGMLELRVQIGSGEITLFVLHLKSRFTDRSDDPMSALRRAGEATVVRDRILSIFPDPEMARFLVLGDFNDVPRSRPLAALSHRGKTAIATVVPAMDSRGETWTHCYRKEDSYSRVDYILVSPGLESSIVGDRARISDGSDTLLASDHRPLSVVLDVP